MPDPRGRKPFQPTLAQRKTVRAMTAYGIPQLDICAVIGVSLPTLNKYFGEEIDKAQAEANATVAQRLFEIATKGTGRESVVACIFWLKARAHWRDGNSGNADAEMGKKVQQAEAAKTAGAGTDWGDDLVSPPTIN